MQLPFSKEQFLDVFGAYNETLWPLVVAAWLASLVVVWRLVRGTISLRSMTGFLALQWGWTAVVYHGLYFSAINPAAWLFAALFAVESIGLARSAVVAPSLTLQVDFRFRHIVGVALLIYALLYPAFVVLAGFGLPRAPSFAVPCPLIIFTAGAFVAGWPHFSRWLVIVPIIWSAIGASAAGIFSVQPDYALPVAGLAMLITGIRRAATKPEGSTALGAGIRQLTEEKSSTPARNPSGLLSSWRDRWTN
jgi:hypothetical protein